MRDAPTYPASVSAGARRRRGVSGPLVAALLATGIAVAVAVAVFHSLGSLTFASDDSYIYSGYVKMIFTPGAGLFAYNVGEHSAGTTGLVHYYVQVLLLLPWVALVRRPPLPGELEWLSWIVAWLASVGTAVLLARTAIAVGDRVGLARGWRQTLVGLAAAALVYAHPAHVWGLFSGMENPLATLCAVWLGTLCLSGSRTAAPVGLLSALLCATRPEWIPIAALLPLASAWLRSPKSSRRRDLAIGYAAFVGLMLVMFLPLRLTTGQWQPEAYGARAHLSLRRIVRPDWSGLASVFSHHWTLLLALCAVASVWAARQARSCRSGLAIVVTLLAFFAMRGMFKLTDFNVHDRYVSYLWPTMVLGMLPGLALVARATLGLARSGGAQRRAARPRPYAPPSRLTAALRLAADSPVAAIALLALAASVAVPAALGLRHGVALLRRDGLEMQQVVKAPSQWMVANLPQGSVVCMEPAGAIRTFTDFALVDRTGLTTRHYHRFKSSGGDPVRNYCEYLHAQGVTHVFDYPEHMPHRCTFLQVLNSWEPQPRWQTGGRIAVMASGERGGSTRSGLEAGGPSPLADAW